MGIEPDFGGFSRKTLWFFKDLAENNNKLWFDQHRDEYNEFVMTPARDFVFAMGLKLTNVAPRIIADPRVNRSLFRINRDIRFSKDKSPYKTNMGVWFWEGPLKRMECSGFYFHLNPPVLGLGVGIHMFPKELLGCYRDSVVHAKHGPALARATKQVKKYKYEIGEAHYKKTPRGYDPEHNNAAYLLHNGLFAWTESKIPPQFYSKDLVEYCFKHFRQMAPIHNWLLAMTERMDRKG